MSATELLTFLAQAFFILLSIATVVSYLRQRDAIRRDIALTFSALALPFWIQVLAPLFQPIPEPVMAGLSVVGLAAFVAQPYLLLRLVEYFQPLSRTILRAALAALLLCWVGTLIIASQPSIVITLLMVAYFVLVDGYAMLRFVRGALTASGVVRHRLRFAAAGSGLLSLLLVLAAILAFIPALQPIASPLILMLAVLSAVCYYVGFAPPRWLRRLWQLGEFRTFLLQSTGKSSSERFSTAENYQILCRAALRAVSGLVAAVIEAPEAEGSWKLAYTSDSGLAENLVSDGSVIFAKVWQKRSPAHVRRSAHLNASEQSLLTSAGVDTLLLVPIATLERNWGLLAVFVKHGSLFIDDDLNLLTMLAQHSAILLENGLLVEELQGYSRLLEHAVEQRTLELHRTEAQYRQIVEMAQEGIWVIDAGNQTSFVNPRMVELLGYREDEMIGIPVRSFMDGENETNLFIGMKNGVQKSESQREFKLRCKDGTALWTLLSTSILSDENGHYAGVLAMVVDITARKESEEEIRKLNAELEERVTERTAQLSQVNKELEAFSYSVSHDLRAPLRVLDGFSQALVEDYTECLDGKGQNYLQRIRSNSQRMGQLIDDLLQLSRLSRTAMHIDEVNLSDLAHNIEDELREQQPERDVQFIIEDGLSAQGDARLLHVVLFNLFSNAWKYTRNQVRPCIEFGKKQHNGVEVFFVRDNGAGFDMAYSNKLFGAFQRLHSSNEFEGSGIGLATVQRILHRHGGDIWAEAAVNQGAAFYFTLPK